MTIQSMMMNFYWAINLGALLQVGFENGRKTEGRRDTTHAISHSFSND